MVLTRAIPMGTERSKAERKLFQRIFSTGYRVAATPGRFAAAGARFRTASRRSLNHVFFDPKGGNVVLVQIPCRILLAVGVGYLAQQMLPEGGGFCCAGGAGPEWWASSIASISTRPFPSG